MENQTLPIWKTVRFVLNNLFSNKITYVRNAAFLQFFVSFVGFRILSTLFKGIIILSGQSNFNFSNMKLFFSSPIIILAFIAYLFAVILFVFIEFSLLTFMVYGTISNTHFSWRTSLKNAFGEVRGFFSPQFIFLIVFINPITIRKIWNDFVFNRTIIYSKLYYRRNPKNNRRSNRVYHFIYCAGLFSSSIHLRDSTTNFDKPLFLRKSKNKLGADKKEIMETYWNLLTS